ncbi:kelch repeat-containing protein [Desulforamulus aeronauticus]|uniref:Kelch motif-containing protein n=1 Tax=Desulforamulus aeronauticus DSM 10349 TaxID=1121421 RepID=A0A1M6WG12_9FIRM|nr:kelch repeat-containing protein [Desulforamulus aeronauticus]SHK92544.1 Kelch motif-containing protein [Desulforamulus aeronauticus DSM 10349]
MVVRLKNKSKVISIILIAVILISRYSQPAHATITTAGELSPAKSNAPAVVINNKIYVFGGALSSGFSNNIIKIEKSGDKLIQTVLPIVFPDPISHMSAVATNNKIYLFGGHYLRGSVYSAVDDIYEFDPTSELLIKLNIKLPKPILGMASAVAPNGKVYIFGGNDRSAVMYDDILEFDPQNKTVTIISTKLPSKITYPSVETAPNGKIYIFGGYDYTVTFDSILEFDPQSKTITNLIQKLPNPTYCMSSALLNGKIYLFGGASVMSGTALEYDSIVEFNPNSYDIKKMTEALPTARYYTSSVSLDDSIYIIGGKNLSSGVIKQILRYTPLNTLKEPQLSINVDNDINAALSWTTIDDAAGYVLEKSIDGVNFSTIAEISTTSYKDLNLPKGTYHYRVKAVFGNIASPYSNVVTINIQPPLKEPQLIGNMNSDVNVSLSWTTIDNATGYVLEKSIDGATFTTLAEILSTSTSYKDLNLPKGTYHYRVKAVSGNQHSPYSNVVTINIKPPEPTIFSVYWPKDEGNVRIDWTKGDKDLSGEVQLWKKDTSLDTWMQVKDISDGEKKYFSWVDKNVTVGINYKYQIRVYNPSTWDWQVIAESDWAGLERPYQAPGGLRIISSNSNTATISWNPLGVASGYQIEVSVDDGATWQKSTVTSTSATVPKPCLCRVKAGNHSRGQWSGILTVQ